MKMHTQNIQNARLHADKNSVKKWGALILGALVALTLTACSSGTTVSSAPISFTGVYNGTYQNVDGTAFGTAVLNIVQNEDGTAVSGNVIFEQDDASESTTQCLLNAAFADQPISGFSLTLSIDQGGAEGSVLNIQLTQSNGGNQLDGTYVSDVCSSGSSSGTISFSR